FSYIAAQQHGQNVVLAPGNGTDILAFTNTSDSTPAKFDTVRNFDPLADRIDLSEIPGITSVHYLGSLRTAPLGNVLAPHSVDWFVNTAANQTLVYVNTTATAQSLLGASMEIVLSGQLGLANNNFVLSEPALALKLGTTTAVTLPAGSSVP